MAAMLFTACTPEQPAEVYIPKNTVEFAGNAFSDFSLGADVKLNAVQNPADDSEWTIQAVVPVRKEIPNPLNDLAIKLTPLDDQGVRLRDGLVLEGEDLPDLIPVFNAGENVERVIVFSIANDEQKYMSSSEVTQLLESTKGVRMDFNMTEPVAPQQPVAEEKEPEKPAAAPRAPKTYPMTVDGLCRKYGVYGMLAQYERELRNDNKKAAKRIEDSLWDIEKRVKKDESIPKDLRKKFVEYIEDKEDDIEDRY